jgi:hypothetical protein
MQRAAISAIERPAIFDDQDARGSGKKVPGSAYRKSLRRASNSWSRRAEA